jgi:predicted TIM-barrel fold metal-dependent hydrolase
MLRKRNFVKDLSKLPSDYFRNLYFDMSGTKSSAALQCVFEVTDAEHVLFGSDFPANQNIQQTIAVVSDAEISEADKKTILANPLLGRL